MNLLPLRVFTVLHAVDPLSGKPKFLILKNAKTDRWMFGASPLTKGETVSARAATMVWELTGMAAVGKVKHLDFYEEAEADRLGPPFADQWSGMRIPNYAFECAIPFGNPAHLGEWKTYFWGRRDEIYPLLALTGDRIALDEAQRKIGGGV